MMFPKNWVAKFLQDSKTDEVNVKLVDSIEVPLLEFLHEQAEQEEPFKQTYLSESDVKIISLSGNSIKFNISFNSLDDPDSVSMTSSTEQDLLIVKIPKKLIMNG